MPVQQQQTKGRRQRLRKRWYEITPALTLVSALVSFLCIAFVLGYIAMHQAPPKDEWALGYKAGVAYAEANHRQFVTTMNKSWPCYYAEIVCKPEKTNGKTSRKN